MFLSYSQANSRGKGGPDRADSRPKDRGNQVTHPTPKIHTLLGVGGLHTKTAFAGTVEKKVTLVLNATRLLNNHWHFFQKSYRTNNKHD